MNHSSKTLGVIGGMGPLPTAYFMELVTNMTDAQTDQQHLQMIVYSMPSIPDRTAYILGRSDENPATDIIRIGKILEQSKVDVIAIPCMTSHSFFDLIQDSVSVPVIHAVRKTVEHLRENGFHKVGIMGTSGTIEAGVFRCELEKQGLQAISPSLEAQADVMHLIFNNIKAGAAPEMDRFHAVAQELRDKGAEVIILGCTELSLIKRNYPIGAGFVDALEVLAREAIISCGYPLKEEYQSLITR